MGTQVQAPPHPEVPTTATRPAKMREGPLRSSSSRTMRFLKGRDSGGGEHGAHRINFAMQRMKEMAQQGAA
eukprot:4010629-Pyramimonas_sp.AAC.1